MDIKVQPHGYVSGNSLAAARPTTGPDGIRLIMGCETGGTTTVLAGRSPPAMSASPLLFRRFPRFSRTSPLDFYGPLSTWPDRAGHMFSADRQSGGVTMQQSVDRRLAQLAAPYGLAIVPRSARPTDERRGRNALAPAALAHARDDCPQAGARGRQAWRTVGTAI